MPAQLIRKISAIRHKLYLTNFRKIVTISVYIWRHHFKYLSESVPIGGFRRSHKRVLCTDPMARLYVLPLQDNSIRNYASLIQSSFRHELLMFNADHVIVCVEFNISVSTMGRSSTDLPLVTGDPDVIQRLERLEERHVCTSQPRGKAVAISAMHDLILVWGNPIFKETELLLLTRIAPREALRHHEGSTSSLRRQEAAANADVYADFRNPVIADPASPDANAWSQHHWCLFCFAVVYPSFAAATRSVNGTRLRHP